MILADREEVKRILKEENVAIMTAYMLMHFLEDKEPFGFLNKSDNNKIRKSGDFIEVTGNSVEF